MGTAIIAFKAVAPLFLAIFAGMAFSRSKAVTENSIDILNKYALKIGLPALVIASLMRINPEQGIYARFILINSVYFIATMLLAYPVARIFGLSKQVRSALFLIFSYGNVAYLGIPVLQNSYGEAAVPLAGIISSVYIFWMLTLGVTLIELHSDQRMTAKEFIKNQLGNPLMLSVIIGLAFVLFKIQLPVVINETIKLFAGSVTAVVLFSLGIFLGLHRNGNLRDWAAALAWSVVILLVLPFAFYLVIKSAGLNELQLKSTVLEAAMPLGLTPYALATQYKLETTLIARIVVISTLLSLATIPVWIVVLG
jgi:predicted permease